MAEKQKKYITAKQVCERYGSITEMTLHRWLQEPAMRFPRPIKINRLRFFDIEELDEYDRLMRVVEIRG